jgi:serine/threonine protein kinase
LFLFSLSFFPTHFVSSLSVSDVFIRALGAGGFGSAYVVQHKRTGKLYVFRWVTIPGGILSTELEQEMIMPKSFQSPNIMKVYQTLLTAKSNSVELFLRTEYCDAGDLFCVMNEFRTKGEQLPAEVLRLDFALLRR